MLRKIRSDEPLTRKPTGYRLTGGTFHHFLKQVMTKASVELYDRQLLETAK